jgi:hypothetical protein
MICFLVFVQYRRNKDLTSFWSKIFTKVCEVCVPYSRECREKIFMWNIFKNKKLFMPVQVIVSHRNTDLSFQNSTWCHSILRNALSMAGFKPCLCTLLYVHSVRYSSALVSTYFKNTVLQCYEPTSRTLRVSWLRIHCNFIVLKVVIFILRLYD